MTTKKTTIKMMALCGFFAAMSGVLSQMIIPIGPIPINLTHISVFISAGILGMKYGLLSQATFILMGFVGFPVFAGFKGGVGVLLGPTGGFIWGYLGCAMVVGVLIERFGSGYLITTLAIYVGWIVSYTLGVAWYSVSLDTSLMSALTICVAPFLLGDFLKTIVSVVLIRRLYPVVHKKYARHSMQS